MTVPTISNLPTVPATSDPNFETEAPALFNHIKNTFVSEMNSAISFINSSTFDATVEFKDDDFTAARNFLYMIDTSSGGVSVTLPANPSTGDQLLLMDQKRSFGTNNLTIGRNGQNINGAASDVVSKSTGALIRCIFQASYGWTVDLYEGEWESGTSAGDLVYTGGNVGIGTSAPDTVLEIYADDPILTIRDKSTSASSVNAKLRLAETDASGNLDNYWDMKYTANILKFAQNETDRMVIDSSGNVGIGETSPSSKLDIGLTSSFNKISGKYIDYRQVGDGTNEGYLLLIPAHTTGTTGAKRFNGTIVADRGSTINGNESMRARINVFAAYTNNQGMLELFGGADHYFSKLVIVTFSGVDYIAAYFEQTGGGPANGIFIEDAIVAGLDSNCLTIKYGSEINAVVDSNFGSITSNILGNVGIGTSSPDASLHITKSGDAPAILRLERNDISVNSGDVFGSIEFESNDSSTGSSGVVGVINVMAENSAPDAAMIFLTSNNISGDKELTEKMRITSDGDVEISKLAGRSYSLPSLTSVNPNLVTGTNFNSIPVQVGDEITFYNNQVRTVTAVTNTQLTVDQNWTTSFAATSATGKAGIGFNTKDTERMRITADGKVGIGTSAPQAELEVSNNSSSGSGATLRLSNVNGAVSAGTSAGEIEFYKGDTSGGAGLVGFIKSVASDLGEKYDLAFGAGNSSTLTERMYIKSDGKVGIGTSAPGQLLHVGGDVRGQIYVDGTSTQSPTLTLDNSSYSNGRKWALYAGGARAQNFDIFDLSTTPNATARFSINENGNVGIGTSSPSGKFNVAGGETHLDHSSAPPARGSAVRIASNNDIAIFASNQYWGTDGVGGVTTTRRSRDGGTSAIYMDQRTTASAGDISFGTAPNSTQYTAATMTTRMIVKQAGDVQISTGNLVIGTAGKGIDFGVASGTVTSQLLDDYEEGTFTPTLEPSSGSFTSITHHRRTGNYTKIGDTVHCWIDISTNELTVGTASGGIYISGLPFTITAHSTAIVGAQSGWITKAPDHAAVQSGQTRISLRWLDQSTQNYQNITTSNLKTGTNSDANRLMGISFSYKTS